MKTYKVTKQQIIDAVIEEPLIHGHFFSTDSDISYKTCGVCAVGAVLRRADKKRMFTVSDGESVTEDRYAYCDLNLAELSENFLAILSSQHEYFANMFNSNEDICAELDGELEDIDLQRLHLLSVIEAFCPPGVEFEV